jgi:hypothetical protein
MGNQRRAGSRSEVLAIALQSLTITKMHQRARELERKISLLDLKRALKQDFGSKGDACG